ncbi:SPOC like C-terminal domain-containing protein [Thamnocephalis sphaerospora]|uniref:ATP-dependent DNA helicase II subunit 2 n=1 Tax=Thamnocephalis sphaerospora TaxID=78915 RepID=A0A4P9XX48_9FUNG|nr:SPOC like C-terminal domain-containing protein [Thamnocephalis sphaerospora]|eukprot:RKP10867.1 SPOC like C-terminal domain-containing protein [Thamnocephalis sphaerospora]
MANKEAIVFILDVGPSTWQTAASNGTTRWEVGRHVLSLLISAKVVEARKLDHVGLVLCGTAATDNPLAEPGQYPHITLARPLAMADLALLQSVDETQLEKGTAPADCVDALVVAIDMLMRHCRQLKYSKRIYLITDAETEANIADLDAIQEQLQINGIGLDIVGHDFDAEDAAKSATKRTNEAVLRGLAEEAGGSVFTAGEALQLLSQFRTKRVRPTALFRGVLSIGDCDAQPQASLAIPIHAFAKTLLVKRPTAKKCTNLLEASGETNSVDVVTERHYYLAPEGDGAEQENDKQAQRVEREELEHAYVFGRSLVPVRRVDEEDAARLTTEKSMQVIGFFASAQLPAYFSMGNIYQVCAAPHVEGAARAMSAFAHALYEKDAMALVRYVRVDNASPKLGVLWPRIKATGVFLNFAHVPFADDVRHYLFASLEHTSLPEPTSARKRRRMPTAEQLTCMEAFVDSLDLMSGVVDGEGEAVETLRSRDTVNPDYQRVYQCIQHRALHPSESLPAIDPALIRQFEPLQSAESSHTHKAELALEAAFPVKKVQKRLRQKGKVASAVAAKSTPAETELSIDAILERGANMAHPAAPETQTDDRTIDESPTTHESSQAPVHIHTEAPLVEFHELLSRTDRDFVSEAVVQLGNRIRGYVIGQEGDGQHALAHECLVELRAACALENEAAYFNRYLHKLRDACLGGGQWPKRFWMRVQAADITLIAQTEAADSEVTAEAAAQFLAGSANAGGKRAAGDKS